MPTTRRTLAAYGITPYRVTLALSNDEWAKLRTEAARLKISGARLIERALIDYCVNIVADESIPLPDDLGDGDSEDMVQIQ